MSWLDDVSHLMQLDALAIVDVKVLLLSHCKHVFVIQEVNISHHLLGLELAPQVLLLPIKQRDVPFSRPDQEVLTISREVERLVWREILERQIKDGLGIL